MQNLTEYLMFKSPTKTREILGLRVKPSKKQPTPAKPQSPPAPLPRHLPKKTTRTVCNHPQANLLKKCQ
jgi:hypothetical protein